MHSKHGHGEGSSSILAGNTLIVNWDHEDGSFIAVPDNAIGNQRRKVARAEDTVGDADRRGPGCKGADRRIQPDHPASYDLSNGSAGRECGGLSSNVVASPVSANGIVYAGSSYDIMGLAGHPLGRGRRDIAWEPASKSTRRRDDLMCRRCFYGDSLYTPSNTIRESLPD